MMDPMSIAAIAGTTVGFSGGTMVWVLAPRKIPPIIRVKEGTAVVITRFDGNPRTLFQWKGYHIDGFGDIRAARNIEDLKKQRERTREVLKGMEEEQPEEVESLNLKKELEKIRRGPPLGGLRLIVPGVESVVKYNLRWLGLYTTGEKKLEVKFYDETLKHVLLKPDVYWVGVMNERTSPPERIPIKMLELLVTLRVISPERFLFQAPPNPLENAMARLGGWARSFVGSVELDYLIKIKEKKVNILKELNECIKIDKALLPPHTGTLPLKEEEQIEQMFYKWGLAFEADGIQIRDLNLDTEYEKASAAKRRQEWEALGGAQQVMGRFMNMLAITTGQKEEEIQKFFAAAWTEKDGHLFDVLLKDVLLELTRFSIAVDNEAYQEVRTTGGAGSFDPSNLITLWKRLGKETTTL